MQTTLTLLLSCSFHAPALLLLYSSLAPASALSYSCPTPALILLQPHYCFAPALLLPCSRSYHSQFGSFHHHHHLITFFGTVRAAFYGIIMFLLILAMSSSPSKNQEPLAKVSPSKKHCRGLKRALGKREPLQMRPVDPYHSTLKRNFDDVLRQKQKITEKNEHLEKYIRDLKSAQTAKSKLCKNASIRSPQGPYQRTGRQTVERTGQQTDRLTNQQT